MHITNSQQYRKVIGKSLKMIIKKRHMVNTLCKDAADKGYIWYIKSVNDWSIHLTCPQANINYISESRFPIDDGIYYFECEDFDYPRSNKGQKTCVECGCATEKRRDFSDFSIREFCPRCKI